MVSAVETRDPYTAGHQTRSADLSRAIATEMGLSKEMIDGIRMARDTLYDPEVVAACLRLVNVKGFKLK